MNASRKAEVSSVTMYELFGLTSEERRLLEPLPPRASTWQLVNKLKQLEQLREAKIMKMEAPGATAIGIGRYQADMTLISAAMAATSLRARTAWGKRLKVLEPPHPGASTEQLMGRLKDLENRRESEFLKMEAPRATAVDIAKCQASVTLIQVAMEATVLRARAAYMRSAAERFPTGIPSSVKAWLDEYLKKKLTR